MCMCSIIQTITIYFHPKLKTKVENETCVECECNGGADDGSIENNSMVGWLGHGSNETNYAM